MIEMQNPWKGLALPGLWQSTIHSSGNQTNPISDYKAGEGKGRGGSYHDGRFLYVPMNK